MSETVGEALRAAIARLAGVGHPASDAEELLSNIIDYALVRDRFRRCAG